QKGERNCCFKRSSRRIEKAFPPHVYTATRIQQFFCHGDARSRCAKAWYVEALSSQTIFVQMDVWLWIRVSRAPGWVSRIRAPLRTHIRRQAKSDGSRPALSSSEGSPNRSRCRQRY